MNNSITETKNTLEGLNSRVIEAEELEGKMLKTAENTENSIHGFHKFTKTGQDYRNEAYPW